MTPTNKRESRRWRCNSCLTVTLETDLLRAPSPFCDIDDLVGCPKCKECGDVFALLCDETGCENEVTCGWPTGCPSDEWGGYRQTCHKHHSVDMKMEQSNPPALVRLSEGLCDAVASPCTCPPDNRPKKCQERYALSACRAADLYERLHSMSKSLEGSGRLDEHENPGAYATVLDAMIFVRLACTAAANAEVTGAEDGRVD